MDENKEAGKKGGGIAKHARIELEEKSGKKIVGGENFLPGQKSIEKFDEESSG